MSDTVELRKVVKHLQNASSKEDVVSLLHQLKKFTVNESILRESKAGLAVGKLRTHASKDISELAKDLVKKWKDDVGAAKAAAHPHGGAGATQSASSPAGAAAAAKPTVGVNTAVRKASMVSNGPGTPKTPTAGGVRTLKSDGVVPPFTGEKTRDKCIELVYDALASDSGAPVDYLLDKAKAIEEAVYRDIGGVSQPYPTKMRSLFVNLKDKNNPGLREAVGSGEIPVERFVKMTSQEMASEERKKADEAIRAQNLHNSLGAEEPDAETSAFQCPKCKQRKCRYRQAQTRSADEPMTTFVTCVNCNNRWKFS